MKKQLIIGVLIVLVLISVVVLSNRKKNIQTLSPVQFEQITGKKVENNIGKVPMIEKKVEVKKEKNTKKTDKVPSKAKKKTETKKKSTKSTTKNTPKVSTNVAEMKSYAHDLVISYGWTEEDYNAWVQIINHESSWRVNAENPKSHAYGLCQSLPGNKMASAGSDWRTNYKTQLNWCASYIKGRYGTPSSAWSFWQQHHWY